MPGNIKQKIDDTRAVAITWDNYTCQLLTTTNGYQWSGAHIDDLEMAEAALSVLSEYVQKQKQLLHENPSKQNCRQAEE